MALAYAKGKWVEIKNEPANAECFPVDPVRARHPESLSRDRSLRNFTLSELSLHNN